MSIKELYRDDLLNRFASHTFTETTIESMTLVEFKDGSEVVVARSKKLDVDDAYINIRENMVGDLTILPKLSETERDALTTTTEGTPLLNSTTTNVDRFADSEWVPTNQILEGNYTFQGSTKFGGDTSIAPNGAIDIVGDSPVTARIRTVRFQATANGAAALQLGHSRGSEGSPSALLLGDRLGQLYFVGDDGTTTNSGGPVIRAFCSENWGASAKGSNITFETIANGATDETLSFTVSENGYAEVPEYTVAALPPVGDGGGMIMVTDETGGYTMAFSDATNWRRVQDRAIVS